MFQSYFKLLQAIPSFWRLFQAHPKLLQAHSKPTPSYSKPFTYSNLFPAIPSLFQADSKLIPSCSKAIPRLFLAIPSYSKLIPGLFQAYSKLSQAYYKPIPSLFQTNSNLFPLADSWTAHPCPAHPTHHEPSAGSFFEEICYKIWRSIFESPRPPGERSKCKDFHWNTPGPFRTLSFLEMSAFGVMH